MQKKNNSLNPSMNFSLNMKRKNIAIVFDQLGMGGIQRKITDLVPILSNSDDVEKIVIILEKNESFNFLKLVKANKTKIFIKNLSHSRIVKSAPFSLYIFLVIIAQRCDSVLAFLDICSIAVILSKIFIFWKEVKVVLCEDALTSLYTTYHSNSVELWKIKKYYPLADAIICPTRVIQKELFQKFEIPKTKLIRIPNWTKFSKNKLNIEKNADLIFAGRFEPQKRLDLLLQTVKKLSLARPGISLLMVGDGTQKAYLMNLAKELNIASNITFRKPTPHIAKLMRQSRIMLLTSKYEGMPLSALEGMALGLPIVSLYFPGIEDMISQGKNGFIAKNEEQFVKKILLLLSKPSLLERYSKAARLSIERQFSLSRAYEYKNLLV